MRNKQAKSEKFTQHTKVTETYSDSLFAITVSLCTLPLSSDTHMDGSTKKLRRLHNLDVQNLPHKP